MRSTAMRETDTVELWSSTLPVHKPYSDFELAVRALVQQTQQRVTGFLTRDADSTVASFTRTRYPRKKYGVATLERCQADMQALSEAFGTTATTDAQHVGFRVVLGLVEGYNKDAPVHTVEEVQQALPNVSAVLAEVFAVRCLEGQICVYTEPVAVLSGPTDCLPGVYTLADKLRQERFTVEDFDRQLTFCVETQHCTEPDA